MWELPKLETLSLGKRIWLAIVIVVIVMFVLLIINRFVGEEAGAQSTEACVSDEDREGVRKIMLEALDQGLKEQTVHMYEVWLQDNREQPSRAIKGMQNGISAYIRSKRAALAWNPLHC